MRDTVRRAITAAVVGSALVVLMASVLSAHDTWLLPERGRAPVGTRVKLDLTSGMAFPRTETAIDPARIVDASIRLAEESRPLTRLGSSKSALSLGATLTHAGVATLWVRLKPRTLELTPKQVQEYVDEIGAPDSVRQLYAPSSSPRRWRERYTKHAKSYIAVGVTAGDTSWRVPAGLSLEIVPMTDPTSIAPGDTVVVGVMRDGVPAVDFPVGDVPAGETSQRLSRTDAQGVARIAAPRHPGSWMLRGTDLRRPVSGTDLDWESNFTTLTLFVGPARG
jgi:uncharacterized GH25 family protein